MHLLLCSGIAMHCVVYTVFITVELQWLEHVWNQENMFETGVVRVNEC